MECLGGNGYVEDSVMPRHYREAPVNAIWEGSGNVMCLDVLRAVGRERDVALQLLDRLHGEAKGLPGVAGAAKTVAEMLSLPPARALLGNVTQDRTGLTDRYTIELDYLFPLPTPGAAPPEFANPSLSTAIREQLGLRLVPSKGRLDLIVIERAQLPTGN